MKKLIALSITAVIAGLIGCSASVPNVSIDTAPFKYLEYMYTNENGKNLMDGAMSGITPTTEIQQRVDVAMKSGLLDNLGKTTENASAVNWWEKHEINADELAAYMKTAEGKAKVEAYLSGTSGSSGMSVKSAKSGYSAKAASFDPYSYIEGIVGDYNDIAVSFSLLDPSKFTPIEGFISTKIRVDWMSNDNDPYFNETYWATINVQFPLEETLYNITCLDGWLKEKDLRDAKTALSSKLVEFANISGIDNAYRRNEIKEFFTDGYENMYNLAYISALERTYLLNSRTGYAKVPGIMLYSDILFMRALSDTRLAYAPNFYSAGTLITYRGNCAREDIKKLKSIKEAFLSDPNAKTDMDTYNNICALLAAWEITLRAHIETAYSRTVTRNPLSDPRIINLDNTVNFMGRFGDMDGNTANGTVGNVLSDRNGNPLMGAVHYGDDISAIFDTGVSGALAAGKSVRIVHDGKNAMTGLGLLPIATDLSGMALPKPDGTHVFIDPAIGRFVLPAPIFWSKYEDENSFLKPEIYMYDHVPALAGNACSWRAGKLNKCSSLESWTNNLYQRDEYPFGNYVPTGMGKGTISAWVSFNNNIVTGNGGVMSIKFGKNSQCNIQRVYGSLCGTSLMVNGVLKPAKDGLIGLATWHHIYIVWDNSGSLANGKTVKMYLDGNLIDESDLAFEQDNIFIHRQSYQGFAAIDNLKIWNHVVTEDPRWEYNAGAGNEGGLHSVYGLSANYMPKITGMGNGVGFNFLN
ncbi:MAG: LamG domain-containing protein [Spirochaetes bacterium]|nr:LamG domain-containing protein [Spirochaetota bacterium]